MDLRQEGHAFPAGLVERIDPDDEKVYVRATKDQIKSAPEFDDETSRDDRSYRDRLGRHYGGGDREHASTR